MSSDTAVRELLSRALTWQDAHVTFDDAVANVPPDRRGVVPPGAPYSLWQLLGHLRLAQADILDFCRNPGYEEHKFPDDYWPTSASPPTTEAWDNSVRQFKADRQAMVDMALDPQLDLAATIPHGSGQTYLREIVLVIDHNAYHVGQLIVIRKLLGIWP